MAFEKTTRDPLVDDHSDHENKSGNANIELLRIFSLLNGLEEEGLEGLERVLVHVIDDIELDEQEVEHGTLGSDGTVSLS